MRLALIFNPFKYKVHEENLRVVQKFFGLFPPLSLAWVAAIAEKAGHQAIIIDARTLKLSKEDVLARIKDFKPDILGFMMTTYMFQDTLEWIKFLKKNYPAPVVIGGYNMRVYPRQSVMHPEIDFGVVEHAYYTIPALFKELESPNPRFDAVPGLVYKRNNEIIVTAHPQRINFDDFPNPARHLLPNELYAEFPTERRNFTVMVTSLGCPHSCGFCEAGNTSYSPRSAETVVQEIEECYSRYNIREVDIFDYEFTGMRERVLAICELLKEKKLDITWACRSRVDTVDEQLLKEMKDAGCRRIYFGVESGVQQILDRVNKRITLRKVRDVVEVCKEQGIRTLGFFLIGAPGETRETVKETVRFAKELDFDYVQFSKCLAKPLTPLWKQMKQACGKDYWEDWILGKETDRSLDRPWTALTDKEVDALARRAYISYYLRFAFLIKAVMRVKSLGELKRKALALFDMLLLQEKVSTVDQEFSAFNENTHISVDRQKKELTIKATS